MFDSRLLVALVCLIAGACSSTNKGPEARPFEVRSLAKSDVDMVAETHLRESMAHLEVLMLKLYKRNPGYWRGRFESAESAVSEAWNRGIDKDHPGMQGQRGTDAILQAFEPSFGGDRVLSFVAGLGQMIIRSYNGKQEFYLLDRLEPQKLHNAARNLEIAFWRLAHRKQPNGQPYLLSNSISPGQTNLSFERLTGKLIGIQDTMAQIVANATHRKIKNTLQSLARAVFLPV